MAETIIRTFEDLVKLIMLGNPDPAAGGLVLLDRQLWNQRWVKCSIYLGDDSPDVLLSDSADKNIRTTSEGGVELRVNMLVDQHKKLIVYKVEADGRPRKFIWEMDYKKSSK
ncbi:MAG: hypothetical protein Q7T51_02985 [Candidatus Moranbacteria bacterium]|nr:hypothetical protein [Candidatus Moranbacteria bacterium]